MVLIFIALILDGQRRLFSQHFLQSVHSSGIQITGTIIETATGVIVEIVFEHFTNLRQQNASTNHVDRQLRFQKYYCRCAQLIFELVRLQNGNILRASNITSVLKSCKQTTAQKYDVVSKADADDKQEPETQVSCQIQDTYQNKVHSRVGIFDCVESVCVGLLGHVHKWRLWRDRARHVPTNDATLNLSQRKHITTNLVTRGPHEISDSPPVEGTAYRKQEGVLEETVI